MQAMASESDALTRDQRIWRWKILVSTYMTYAGYYLTRKVFGICKTTIAKEFHWELSWTGYIWTAYLVAYAAGQFISSFAGRRWGPKIILVTGLAISMGCNVFFGFANSFSTFIVFMIVNGLVQATGWPGVVGGVSQWIRKKERGAVMGVWSTSYLVGNLVVKSVGALMLDHWGWRWAFWGCTMITLGIWALLILWHRDRPEDAGLEPFVHPEKGDDTRAVKASQSDHVSFKQYMTLASHPIVLAMGASYFFVKFLRYMLDSWLPAFLNIQGMNVKNASYYSAIFDFAGMGGAILAGWLMDKHLKGRWAGLCFTMGLGMIVGYALVLTNGSSPVAQAIAFGLVGFMIYGPDTILCGAASVSVAGERNAIAVAGIVNGIGSIAPPIQELVVSWFVRGTGREQAGIVETNQLAFVMSILFAVMMFFVMLMMRRHHAKEARIAEAKGAGGNLELLRRRRNLKNKRKR